MSLNIVLGTSQIIMVAMAASTVWDTAREYLVKLRAKRLLRKHSDPELKADLLRLRGQGLDDRAVLDIHARLMRSLQDLDSRDQRRFEQGFSRRSRSANQRFAEDLLDVA
jgi:hypothetical protein